MKEQSLYTACVTPFEKNGTIDYASLKILLYRQEECNNGLLLLGSTGESLSINDNEKKELMQFVCNLNLNTSIIVGIPSYNLCDALEWIKFCNALPIQGYLISTPIYTKPGVEGQYEWFKALCDASQHDVMLYNIPGRAGVKLHLATVQRLASHEKFTAIKDSGGDIENFLQYKFALNNIKLFCGDDYLASAMMRLGAGGLVSVISNMFPKFARDVVTNNLNLKDIELFYNLAKVINQSTNPLGIKYLLHKQGIINHNIVRRPLSINDIQHIESMNNYLNHIQVE